MDDTKAPSLSTQALVDLIRSDQMTAEQVEDLLQRHPLFARWYRTVGIKRH